MGDEKKDMEQPVERQEEPENNNSEEQPKTEEKKPEAEKQEEPKVEVHKSNKEGVSVWMIASIALGILLVLSIFSGGFGIFGGDATGAAVTDVEAGDVIVLNDERCADCDVSQLIVQLKTIFPDNEFKEIDYSSKEGKELFDSTGVKVLPAILFDASVNESAGYTNVANYLSDAGDYQSLMIGAKFDPTKEICTNGVDDTGNGDVDCEDADCKESMECREEIKNRIDLFVMSQCPYGTKALDAMKEVLANFEDIDFNVNFIANEKADGGFNSLHGQAEVDEDIRELCAIEHYPDDYKYMDYIWCRNKDISSSDWEGCAEEAGMDVDVIKECFEGDEGKSLLSENIKIANSLGVSASPTWLANNRFKFSGIDSETVKSNYCKHNDVDGCDSTLSTDSSVSGSC